MSKKLDARVSLVVFDSCGKEPWSTDMNAAMEMVDEVMKDGYLVYSIESYTRGTVEVEFQSVKTGDKWEHTGDSLPEALCLAVLRYKGEGDWVDNYLKELEDE